MNLVLEFRAPDSDQIEFHNLIISYVLPHPPRFTRYLKIFKPDVLDEPGLFFDLARMLIGRSLFRVGLLTLRVARTVGRGRSPLCVGV